MRATVRAHIVVIAAAAVAGAVGAAAALHGLPSSAEEPPGTGAAETPPATPSPTPTPDPGPLPWYLWTPNLEQPSPGPPVPADGPELPPMPAEPYPHFGLVEADPVRVSTGGDCLNARLGPSLSAAVYTCVPDGTRLWLWGEARDTDGETWRYALGFGYVAVRYTEPDPVAPSGFGPFAALRAVGALDSIEWWTQVAEIRADGTVVHGPWFPYSLTWSALGPSPISPSGRYLASRSRDARSPSTQLIDLETEEVLSIPGSTPLLWGPGDRLLLAVDDPPCVTEDGRRCSYAAWWEPGLNEAAPLPAETGYVRAWLPDGSGIIVWGPGPETRLIGIDGSVRTLPVTVNSNSLEAWVADIAVSPDGARAAVIVLGGPSYLVDLASGAAEQLDRPAEEFLPRCGGGPGRIAAWADDRTLVWHEPAFLGRDGGLVIYDVVTRQRRFLPFPLGTGLAALPGGFIGVTTAEWPLDPEEKRGNVWTSWLLDPQSGELHPVAFGAYAVWR